MATRLEKKTEITFTLFLVATAVLFVLLATKHYNIDGTTLRHIRADSVTAVTIAATKTGLANPCADDETFVAFSPTIYICDQTSGALVYGEIYDFYPGEADGREEIYDFMSRGDKSRADEMLENIYNLERYPASTLTSPLTWQEDPFDERYWRFLFYSLRPLRHLIATAEETGSERYYDKIREITESFTDVGMAQPHAWDDAHAVAFRTMMLVNVWWKLRSAGELPGDLSDKILSALETHGNFLLDPQNYEDDYNHAITQSAALLLTAENFPDLANAETWRETALRRLEISLSSIVDPNGVLVENSPYYHFYVLEKYWQISQYAKEHSVPFSDRFSTTVDEMINFATYVLTPNLSVPLLGASSPRTFLRSGDYREIAEVNPKFNYVLTKGREGTKPTETNVLFPSSGIVILRSGWGQARDYQEESQMVFDTGPYRTDHSDYDLFTVMLYSRGASIIRDAGLFTYEEEHPLYAYFHGTRGHNTVMVDNTDQPPGDGETQPLQEDGGVVSVSASHQLYEGVSHSRTVAMLSSDDFLIVDDLLSSEPHLYEQLWHLDQNATTKSGEVLEGAIELSDKTVYFSIDQLIGEPTLTVYKDNKEPIRGLCATSYENYVPCEELSFSASTTHARFLTYLHVSEVEGVRHTASYDEASGIVHIETADDTTYELALTFPDDNKVTRRFILVENVRGNTDDSTLTKVRKWWKDLF